MTNNAPTVASIFPMERRLDKWSFIKQKVWYLPPVPKGLPPATVDFEDQQERVMRPSDGWVPQYGFEVIPAAQIANNFLAQNKNFALGQKRGGEPGVWLVGSLGQDVTLNVAAASNSPAVALRLDRPHKLNGAADVTIANGQGFWGSVNGVWRATPIDDLTIQIQVDSSRMGDYYASGSTCQVYTKNILSLDQESQVMAKRQDIFAQMWVEDARKNASRNHMDRIIPMHHAMADWLGLDKEPWRKYESSADVRSCPFCLMTIPAKVATCPLCRATVDAVLKYQLEKEENARLQAHKLQKKAEQDELDRLERERNQNLRQSARQVVIQAEPVQVEIPTDIL